MVSFGENEEDPDSQLVIVSNRLPVTVSKEKGKLVYTASSGGLATAMSSVKNEGQEKIWVGWPGIASDEITSKERTQINKKLKDYGCYPVHLTKDQVQNFYSGYANDTLWPLFHYFPVYAQYKSSFWEAYIKANDVFKKAVLKVAKTDSKIWIHDYQLMLLPNLLRQEIPKSTIGFFMHIPFPSYEVFRLLPERKDVLKGLLGADLVGFHIHDYARHFLNSSLRLLGLENKRASVNVSGRKVKADSFPIGIDFNKFENFAKESNKSDIGKLVDKEYENQKVILSVDRLDYSKGIVKRLEAFELFLNNNPKYREKVKLVVVAVPSRTDVDTYKELRRKIEHTISRINGTYSALAWAPISYQFRNLAINELSALYRRSDIALVTPLRDGMNLVAKEYVASRINNDGVLILSEMAGAADEMQEALRVNPNDINSIANALEEAMEMPTKIETERIKGLKKRLSQYTVQRWAADFLEQLDSAKKSQALDAQKVITKQQTTKLKRSYTESIRRAIFLDYDGTLKKYSKDFSSSKSAPSKSLLETLGKLSGDKSNTIYIISGRPHDALEKWLGHLPLNLVAEHGAWIKTKGKWKHHHEPINGFKKNLLPVLEKYTERTPGSRNRDKNFFCCLALSKCFPGTCIY